jgi:hypothetical protein
MGIFLLNSFCICYYMYNQFQTKLKSAMRNLFGPISIYFDLALQWRPPDITESRGSVTGVILKMVGTSAVRCQLTIFTGIRVFQC